MDILEHHTKRMRVMSENGTKPPQGESASMFLDRLRMLMHIVEGIHADKVFEIHRRKFVEYVGEFAKHHNLEENKP